MCEIIAHLRLSKGEITFDLLWAVFFPQSFIFTRCGLIGVRTSGLPTREGDFPPFHSDDDTFITRRIC